MPSEGRSSLLTLEHMGLFNVIGKPLSQTPFKISGFSNKPRTYQGILIFNPNSATSSLRPHLSSIAFSDLSSLLFIISRKARVLNQLTCAKTKGSSILKHNNNIESRWRQICHSGNPRSSFRSKNGQVSLIERSAHPTSFDLLRSAPPTAISVFIFNILP
ncbi:hypothetical protein RIF29_07345 [Crotalaria pallida]|uniref:Uncharacterized protein n=1 Tax=Crotalaria pallida TaxID=3830 RepID=A0AAN9PAS6_CROPI